MIKHGVSAIIYRIGSSGVKEYLLIRANKERGEHTGKYYPPGGWIDNGETEQEAVIRELKEELNLDINVIKKIASIPGDIDNLMLHFWECEIIGGQLTINQRELNDVNWFDSAKMKEIAIYPATKIILNKYLFENI